MSFVFAAVRQLCHSEFCVTVQKSLSVSGVDSIVASVVYYAIPTLAAGRAADADAWAKEERSVTRYFRSRRDVDRSFFSQSVSSAANQSYRGSASFH